MPELPEVETALRGIEPHLTGATLIDVVVRDTRLRWPVDEGGLTALIGKQIINVSRRAKYLLLHCNDCCILLHLGMSGSVRVLDKSVAPVKHDHIDLVVKNSSQTRVMRLNDPRRFGCCLVIPQPVTEHPLLAKLGPEPLSAGFDGVLLHKRSRGRNVTIKAFIMDGKIVVGVGNIYASEALFLAGIRPSMKASKLSKPRAKALALAIKSVLAKAIKAGGTTLNDFTNPDGKPGYFAQELLVYGREGKGCLQCSNTVKSQILGQRNTFYCPSCQSF